MKVCQRRDIPQYHHTPNYTVYMIL